MKILNFGSCNVDYVYSLDHIVAVGETETTYKLETFPGGKGLNQSIALAKAGAEVYHAGCVGFDGGMLTDILEDNGVDISFIRKVDEKNGHAIIQVSEKGENSIFLYPGSNEQVTKEFINSVLNNFDKGDIILLQNEISNVDYIIEQAHKKKMTIVLNPSPFNEKMAALDFSMISIIILNEVEAKAISGEESPEENILYFRRKYPGLKVMLTLGSKGCVYSDDTNEIYQSAFQVKAVDTTAAGDTFTGYFIAGMADCSDYVEILRTASAASAISVSRMGAAPSIPYKTEVLEKINDLQENVRDNKTEEHLRKIKQYIDENIKIANLSELSKVLGYSPVYSGTLVKKLTGKSFSKFLQDERCVRAAKLLAETDLPAGEIINSVGYENESFFRKIFFDKYGLNPLEYRKRAKGERKK